MALKAILDSLEGAEALKDHYTEKDGKFYLNVEPVNGFALEDITGLKTALSKERGSRETLERAAAKWKDLDPDKARDALARLAEIADLDPKKEADKIALAKIEELKKQLLDKHSNELKTREDRAATLLRQIESLLIDSAATAALAESKGSVDLLLPHVRSQVRVKEQDGKFSVEVINSEGNTRVNNAANPMTIAELVAEMKASEKFGRAFEASGQSGGGAKGGGGGGAQQKGDLGGTKSERAAAIAARFPELGKQ